MGNFDPQSASTAEVIRVGLARKRSTQGALASHLHLSQPAVHRRMTGKVDWRITELAGVAEFLSVDVAELVGSSDDAVVSA